MKIDNLELVKSINLINLAQFERKQTAERVSLNFHSRAKRGLRNGAPVILGFDIDESNRSVPKVNFQEAAIVRNIFSKFLEIGTLRGTVTYLNANGIKPKKAGKRLLKSDEKTIWYPTTLLESLRNPAYVGLKEVNKKYKDEDHSHLLSWQKYEVVKASWPPLVDRATFDIVQSSLDETRLKERERLSKSTRREFLLSIFFACGDCGRSIVGHTNKGRSSEYRYYSHKSPPGVAQCKVQRFRADEVESVVVNHLREMLSRAGAFNEIEGNLNKVGAQNTNDVKSEIQSVEKEIQKIDLDIESTFQVLSKMSNSEGAVNLAGKRLENLNSDLEKKMNRMRDLEDGLPNSVDPTATRDFIHTRWEEFKRGWAKGTSAQKKRLLRRLIYKLVPADGGFKVYYVTGEQDFVQGTASAFSEPKHSVMSEIEPDSQFHAKRRHFFMSQSFFTSLWHPSHFHTGKGI